MDNQPDAYHRHDLSDHAWELLSAHLPGQAGQWGGIAQDNRRFLNAVFWILRTGAPWRDLPPDYGDWKNTHRRFCRWRDKGLWEKLLEQLIDDPDFEWLMIDASHIKAHAHATGADCTQAGKLIEGLEVEHLITDKGYDSDDIVAQAAQQGMQAQIPPRSHRKQQRDYDKHLYKLRHLMENAIRDIKQWRGVATRYAKRADSFLAAVQIRCMMLWIRIS